MINLDLRPPADLAAALAIPQAVHRVAAGLEAADLVRFGAATPRQSTMQRISSFFSRPQTPRGVPRPGFSNAVAPPLLASSSVEL